MKKGVKNCGYRMRIYAHICAGMTIKNMANVYLQKELRILATNYDINLSEATRIGINVLIRDRSGREGLLFEKKCCIEKIEILKSKLYAIDQRLKKIDNLEKEAAEIKKIEEIKKYTACPVCSDKLPTKPKIYRSVAYCSMECVSSVHGSNSIKEVPPEPPEENRMENYV